MKGEEDRVVIMSAQGYAQLVNTTDGKNLFWTSDINTELPIKLRKSGIGSEPPKTIGATFREIAYEKSEKIAMQVQRNGKDVKWTWK